jgi:uncharacterized protein (TIGR03032 family)
MLKNMENAEIKPFLLDYSRNLPQILNELRISIALTTYQAGKVIFISAPTENNLIQKLRSFRKPMGLHYQNGQIVLATKQEVIVFNNAPELAATYPRLKNRFDALFLPRVSYHSNYLDIHDVTCGENGEILVVNTAFSCIAQLDSFYNFKPIWKPDFITQICPEDRCHLNGMVVENGQPVFATAFSQTNIRKGWKADITNTGVLFDIVQNKILFDNLPMPHSPKMYKNELYLLLSATGELIKINPKTATYEVVFQTFSFVRGLAFYGDYAFIGSSRFRKTSSTFAKLSLPLHNDQCGFIVVHLPTRQKVAELRYQNSVNELYEVAVLPNCIKPCIVNKEQQEYNLAMSSPSWKGWRKAKKKATKVAEIITENVNKDI